MNLPKLKKIFKWIGIVLFGSLVILLILMNFALPFNESDKKLAAYLDTPNIVVSIEHIPVQNHRLRIISTHQLGDQPDSTVVFIHGTPGSLSDFKAFLKDTALLAKYTLVGIDRPGYGGSLDGLPIEGIEEQAHVLMQAIQKAGFKNLILVGHSYGGPIAAKMAADFPNEVKGLLLLAPVNEAESEPKYKFWALLGSHIPFRWVLPSAIVNASVEKLEHPAELEKLESGWGKIQCPTIHLHGDRDFLAPPSNMAFTRHLIPAVHYKLIELADENHFLPWTQHEKIKEVLLDFG